MLVIVQIDWPNVLDRLPMLANEQCTALHITSPSTALGRIRIRVLRLAEKFMLCNGKDR